MSAPVAVGCAAAALLLGLPLLGAAVHLEAVHRAAGAADAAALAAADAAAGWISAEPCEIAAEVVAAAHASILSCTVDAERAEATITVSVSTPVVAVQARARAGPEPVAAAFR